MRSRSVSPSCGNSSMGPSLRLLEAGSASSHEKRRKRYVPRIHMLGKRPRSRRRRALVEHLGSDLTIKKDRRSTRTTRKRGG